MKHLGMDNDTACRLADGIAKRMNFANKELFSYTRVEKNILQMIWKNTPYAQSRVWIKHYASTLFDAMYLLNNGSEEWFAEHPIVIGGKRTFSVVTK